MWRSDLHELVIRAFNNSFNNNNCASNLQQGGRGGGERGGGGCGYTVNWISKWMKFRYAYPFWQKKKKKMSISVFKRSFNHHSSGIDVIKKYWRILTRILSTKSLEFRNKFKSEITILWNISSCIKSYIKSGWIVIILD